MSDPAKKPRLLSPLAIAGIVLLVIGLIIAGLIYVLKAEPTHVFYIYLITGLSFLAINPFIIRTRSSLLWQGLLIGAAAASLTWSFFV